jgi:glycosyltransferase involved in cell wall biosynthesis
MTQAMSLGTPVIAVRSGGPLETVKDLVTGFLCREVSKKLGCGILCGW